MGKTPKADKPPKKVKGPKMVQALFLRFRISGPEGIVLESTRSILPDKDGDYTIEVPVSFVNTLLVARTIIAKIVEIKKPKDTTEGVG